MRPDRIDLLFGPRIEIVGFEIAGRQAGDGGGFALGQPDRQGLDDAPDQLVLQLEDPGGAAVIALRPDVARGGGIGELHIDPNGVARTADVASEHVTDPQLLGDLADVLGLALERERRVPGDHRQP